MRAARILPTVWVLVCIMPLVGHVLTLPDHPVRSRFAAAGATKGVTFSISGEPSGAGWAAGWGRNRPSTPRPHPIMSEVEARIRHEIRPEGLVGIAITGDSEGDVDAIIDTLKHDFDRSYGAASAPGGEPSPKSRGRFHSLFEPGRLLLATAVFRPPGSQRPSHVRGPARHHSLVVKASTAITRSPNPPFPHDPS